MAHSALYVLGICAGRQWEELHHWNIFHGRICQCVALRLHIRVLSMPYAPFVLAFTWSELAWIPKRLKYHHQSISRKQRSGSKGEKRRTVAHTLRTRTSRLLNRMTTPFAKAIPTPPTTHPPAVNVPNAQPWLCPWPFAYAVKRGVVMVNAGCAMRCM